MKRFIIVWYDNIEHDFDNDNYEGVTKSEAIRRFYDNHNENAVIVNIIDDFFVEFNLNLSPA